MAMEQFGNSLREAGDLRAAVALLRQMPAPGSVEVRVPIEVPDRERD